MSSLRPADLGWRTSSAGAHPQFGGLFVRPVLLAAPELFLRRSTAALSPTSNLAPPGNLQPSPCHSPRPTRQFEIVRRLDSLSLTALPRHIRPADGTPPTFSLS